MDWLEARLIDIFRGHTLASRVVQGVTKTQMAVVPLLWPKLLHGLVGKYLAFRLLQLLFSHMVDLVGMALVSLHMWETFVVVTFVCPMVSRLLDSQIAARQTRTWQQIVRASTLKYSRHTLCGRQVEITWFLRMVGSTNHVLTTTIFSPVPIAMLLVKCVSVGYIMMANNHPTLNMFIVMLLILLVVLAIIIPLTIRAKVAWDHHNSVYPKYEASRSITANEVTSGMSSCAALVAIDKNFDACRHQCSLISLQVNRVVWVTIGLSLTFMLAIEGIGSLVMLVMLGKLTEEVIDIVANILAPHCTGHGEDSDRFLDVLNNSWPAWKKKKT